MANHHGHSHASADFGKAFGIGVALNTLYVVCQVVFGVSSRSVALLADAGHNLGDVATLLLAWGAIGLGKRPPTARRSYGFGSTSILAALLNAVLLLVAVGGIAWEAIQRLSHPQPIAAHTVAIVAALGIVVNGSTAMLFLRGREHDLNLRGAFLHLTADAAISAGVVAAALVVAATGWLWVDPVVSLTIVFVVMLGTWSLLRDSVNMALQAVPPGTDAEGIQGYLAGLPGVTELHDLHIWALSTTDTALTAHLVIPGGIEDDAFLADVTSHLHDVYRIEHATIQIERGDHPCPLAPTDVV